MIDIKSIDSCESQIGIIYINKTSDEFLAELDNKSWYYHRLRFMSEIRKQEWLATRVLLKKMLMTEKKIIYTRSGSPYVSNKRFCIGISHTKKYATIIINKWKRVSIDIESISPRIERIQNRFINRKEKNNLSIKNPLIHLLLHWSAKEVLCKFLDKKNVEFKTKFHINHFEPKIGLWSNFTANEILGEKCRSFNIQYNVTDDYVLCLLV
ncbi:MAG: 4'-phosphopantetheinyl transferase superfamily protein [Bacteroidales bacterium OttesenSCG-928-I14]|jgi:4'-phosphopantetheinyl transferase EntD|nr:4'-phosphopantetheinyl transferase superfamily protein [Bacteroidales bacterium OttesenSCG-928-I14]